MKEIDWSKAPEGCIGAFVPKENNSNKWFFVSSKFESAYSSNPEFYGATPCGDDYHVYAEYWDWIARPVEWTGTGLPPVSYLRERLSYDCKTGSLVWLPRPSSDFTEKHHYASWVSRFEGKEAGVIVTKKRKKYRRIDICGKKMYAHRIAWAIHYGEHPDEEIDHINGDSLDNSIANLRKVSRQENCRNVKLHDGSRSGYCGVNWHEETGKWRARVKINGKEKYIGLFDDPCEAAERIKALRDALGFHSGHGSTLRTTEQIAAAERDRELADMREIVKQAHYALLNTEISPSEKAAAYVVALYDAGYRKQ